MGLTRFFRRRYWDDERRRELAAYLEQEIEDNLASGMTPADARRAAHLKLGNVTRIREEVYEMNTFRFLESVWQDVRYGLRILRRNSTFAAVAILTLALGTGANAAIFQLVDAVRLRTLPVSDPQALVELQIDSRDKGRTGRFQGRRPMFTNALWQRLHREQQGFASMLAWSPRVFDLASGGEVRNAEGLWVSGGFFETLGVQAARGRVIDRQDDTSGCSAPGVVLSDGFWRREFGADPGIVGRTMLLDGRRFEIVGVTPESFFGVDVGRSFDVALPLCSEPLFNAPSFLASPDTWFLAVMGRLESGWSAERAEAQLRAVFPAILEETLPPRYVPEDARDYLAFLIDVVPASTGVSQLRRSYSTPLWILFGATGLVLLITCANLANLMLARATARAREIGVRLAMGASRGRIVRQMLSESLLIALLGGIAGALVARWLSEFLVRLLSTDLSPLFLRFTWDWRVIAFIAVVATLACLLFGLAPALRATSPARAGALGTRTATDPRERLSLRRMLVVVQVALSLVLLVGALLFALSLRNLLTMDPGFREEGVVVVNLDLRRTEVAPGARRGFFNTIVDRVQGVPGVNRAAEVFIAPMSGSGWNNRIVIDGEVQPGLVNFNGVGPGYFDVLRTRFVAGRDFNARDTPQSPRVAIVNELFVSKYLAGSNPVGRVFHIEESPGSAPNPGYQIVGVVRNTNYSSLREDLPPIAYLAATQEVENEPFLQIILHSSADLAAVAPGIARTVRDINPAIPIRFSSMDTIVSRSLTTERLMATLSGFFGVLAVLIATLGLYGVMSYMVARRRVEIGIRMALGADRGSVVRMVVADAARLLAIGLVAGLALSLLSARTAGALLYGLEPWDPATLTLAAAVLGTTALVASWLPAYRASRVSPTIALREE
jgi:predicted permease